MIYVHLNREAIISSKKKATPQIQNVIAFSRFSHMRVYLFLGAIDLT